MKADIARELGTQLVKLITSGDVKDAVDLIVPVLAGPIPFSTLDLIGGALGAVSLETMQPFIEGIAEGKSMGGWVVIASALQRQLDRDLDGALTLCREYTIQADVWYATDIFGERVVGPALRVAFQPALQWISSWRHDANRWVRRSVGVAIHLWTKRSRGDPELADHARQLLIFLEPTFEERNQDAVKGIGWGLKTLGKYYPDLVAAWLENQLIFQMKKPRSVMLRKALTYLSPEKKVRATGDSKP